MEKKVIKKSNVAKKVTKEKKRPKVEEKKSVPLEEPKSIKIKRFLSSYEFLYPLFAILLIIVIVLAIQVTTKKNKQEINKGDIVFSIIEKNTNSSLSVDLKGLVDKKYALKVTNNRNNKLCSEDIPYKIHVINNSNVEIEILKDGGADNLMVNQKNTIIEAEALGCDKNNEAIYYFKVLNKDKIKDNDKIEIEVIS